MVPFCPEKEPFISYARNIRRFVGDLGVARAVQYYSQGIIPEGFRWLRRLTTDDCLVDIIGSGSKPFIRERPRRKSADGPPVKLGRARQLPREKSSTVKSPANNRSGKLLKVRKEYNQTEDAKPSNFNLATLSSPPSFNKFEKLAHLLPPPVVYSRL